MTLPLIVRVDADDTRSAEQLKLDGWREIEVLETWRHPCRMPLEPVGPADFCPAHTHKQIREMRNGCIEVVKTVNWKDRLHWDNKVDRAVADKAKIDWVCRLFDEPPYIQPYIALVDGRVAGFLARKNGEDWDEIDLFAVHADFAGRGIGWSLFCFAVFRSYHNRLQAGTQHHNDAARRFYERGGMELVRSQMTFHKDQNCSA